MDAVMDNRNRGMTRDYCVATVPNAVCDIRGVEHASVTLMRDRALVIGRALKPEQPVKRYAGYSAEIVADERIGRGATQADCLADPAGEVAKWVSK